MVPTLIQELESLHADNFGWALLCCDWQHAQASDVLQEAYLRVLDGRARFTGSSAAKTWFFGVIRFVAAEERRAGARRWLPDLKRTEVEPADQMSGPEALQSSVEADEQAAQLRHALRQLSGRQRELLHLVFYAEMRLEDAAEVVGIGLGSARTHYHRGKQRLVAMLEVNGGQIG